MNKRQMLYNIIIVVMVIIFLLLVAIGLIRSARIIRVDANAFAKGREETETETTTVTESETEKTTVAESGMTTMTASIDKMKENDSGKRIALTFDDGPHPCYTEQLLDGLKERGVVATFFVIGESAAKHPDLVQRMAKEGHLIGNHTYTHIQLCDENVETFEKELLQTNELLRELTGQDTQYVRPPFGTWDPKMETKLMMIPVMWTIDPLDWCTDDCQQIIEKVIGCAREDAIILLHDEYRSSVIAALAIVDILEARGYEFVTVDELLFD